MEDLYDLMVLFTLVLGVYFLACGLLKKGGIYRNNFPKEIKEEVKKSVSIVAIITGSVLTVSSVLEILSVFNQDVVVYTSIVLCIGVVVVYGIYFRKKFGRYIR